MFRKASNLTLALLLIWLIGCTSAAQPGYGGPKQKKISYPSPPPPAATETDYTRNFREKLRQSAAPAVEDEAKAAPEEPIETTIERIYR